MVIKCKKGLHALHLQLYVVSAKEEINDGPRTNAPKTNQHKCSSMGQELRTRRFLCNLLSSEWTINTKLTEVNQWAKKNNLPLLQQTPTTKRESNQRICLFPSLLFYLSFGVWLVQPLKQLFWGVCRRVQRTVLSNITLLVCHLYSIY